MSKIAPSIWQDSKCSNVRKRAKSETHVKIEEIREGHGNFLKCRGAIRIAKRNDTAVERNYCESSRYTGAVGIRFTVNRKDRFRIW